MINNITSKSPLQEKFSDTLLNSIKDRTPEILLRVLRPANKSGAICPFCGNGSGIDGDGVTFVPGNPQIIKCFKCGTAKDIFSFVMEDSHCTFQDAVKTCADSAGITLEENFKSMQKSSSSNKKKDLSADFKIWHDDLLKNEKAMAVLKDWHLDDPELIDKFFGFRMAKIKYEEKWSNVPCITIRHSNYYATCRVLPPFDEYQRFASLPRVSVELFNAECLNTNEPVIVTEGAKDALSLMKAGIYNVVAIGGAGNFKILIKALEGIENKPPFMILFDSDETGRNNATKLQKALAKMSILATNETLPLIEGNEKTDANDWLKHDPQQLKEIIEQKISILHATLKDWTSNDDQEENSINEAALNCPLPFNKIKMPGSLKLDFEKHITRGINKVALPETKFNSIMLISKRFKNIDDNLEKVEIAILKPYEKKWKKFATERRNIASRTKIVELASLGLDVTSTRAASVVNYFDSFEVLNTEIIPTIYTVSSTGWRDDDFVYPNTIDSKYELDETIKPQIDKIFTIQGDKQKVIDLMKKLKNNNTANIIIGTSLSAPLVKHFHCSNIAVHLYANTGSGKSTVDKSALSLFANPNLKIAFPNADATRAGLEYFFAARRDLPAIIEDITGINDDKTKKVIASLPYQFVNGTGKLRAKKTGGNDILLETRGSLITTGEGPLTTDTSSGGGKRRLIEIKGDEKIFDNELIDEIYDTLENNYGLFGRDWIACIKNHKDEMREIYNTIRKGNSQKRGLYQEFRNKIPLHIDSIAAITTANIFFDMYFLDIDFEEACRKELDCARLTLLTLPDEIEIADYIRSKDYIRDWIDSHPKNFMQPTSADDVEAQAEGYETWGVIKSDVIAIYPTIFKDFLNSKGFNADMVTKQLATDGFIIRSNETHINRRVRIDGKLKQMIVIDKEHL